MMQKAAAALLAGLLLAGTTPLSGAEFWEKKKYTQWSEKEARKMLTDSPWARQHTESEVHLELADPLSVSGGEQDEDLRTREQNPRLTYQFQIRSALPIRQALVRLSQLRHGYQQMLQEQRRTFDRETEQFLGVDFTDRVVIYVSWDSNIEIDQRELARHWHAQTTETLRNSVFLLGAKGLRAELMEYLPATDDTQSFQFSFPRKVAERDLVGPGDGQLQLEFIHPSLRGRGERRVLVEFKIKKMLLDGQLEY